MVNIFKKKKIVIWISSIVLSLSILVGGVLLYTSDYYFADTVAIESFRVDGTVQKREVKKGITAYGKEDAAYGIIFYPGGKVEHTAYEPLMRELASKGALCVLVEMPFNLAVLGMNKADGIREQFPNVSRWYMSGHSLGGAMAANYLANHAQEYEGLILLASYSTKDLSAENLRVLSVCASNDTVLNKDKYEECKKNLPAHFIEYTISGGCHAYFGMYGEQEGDGTPTLTNVEQIRKTSEHITRFIAEGVK